MQRGKADMFLMPLTDSKGREIMNYANSTITTIVLCRETKRAMIQSGHTPPIT